MMITGFKDENEPFTLGVASIDYQALIPTYTLLDLTFRV
jgi:hypothetical protein